MYSAEINRNQRACLLLLIDQSYSMSESWAGTGKSKADQLALSVNNILGNAVLLCSKGDDRIFDYFEVGVIGYGSDVTPVLHGTDHGNPLLPIGEVARNPKRTDQLTRKIPDGVGGFLEAQTVNPVWVDPLYNGQTPMVAAFRTAAEITDSWCRRNPRSFPPIVINITDGVSSDGEPIEAAQQIRETGTEDGNVLLFNLHLSGMPNPSAVLPNDTTGLPDAYAKMLFDISSELPPAMLEATAVAGYDVKPGARGFVYNAEAHMVVEFLDIGTRAVTPTGLKELTDGRES
ncbi:vWA domain-containing protein [Saccharopolyspora sp. 5N102]|uniref:vWA domain-containing protein n=1 Tax=Saccharopolyspora sp. 5N102 TaxID=3375155 RepID=UPI00379D8FF9